MIKDAFLSNDIVETKLRCLEVGAKCAHSNTFGGAPLTTGEAIDNAKALLSWVMDEKDNLEKLNSYNERHN